MPPGPLAQARHSAICGLQGGAGGKEACRPAIGSRVVLTGWGQAISEAGTPSLRTRGCLGGAGRWQVPSKAVHAPRLPHAAGTPRHMLVQPQGLCLLLTQAHATHPMLPLHQGQQSWGLAASRGWCSCSTSGHSPVTLNSCSISCRRAEPWPNSGYAPAVNCLRQDNMPGQCIREGRCLVARGAGPRPRPSCPIKVFDCSIDRRT